MRKLHERFWEKAQKGDVDDCWIWQANKNNKGYGLFKVSASVGNRLAHRISYEMAYGPIPKGDFVLHSCDTPLCVNPSHLRTGSQRENVGDAIKRKRHINPPTHIGEQNPKSKLTADIVREIRRLIEDGHSPILIAKKLRMNKSTIYDIRNRKIWDHV